MWQSLLVALILFEPAPLWSERPASAPPLAAVPDFARLAKEVVPAVVSISVRERSGRGLPGGQFFDHILPPREYQGEGIGTGFVIRSDGLILTNFHVVERAESIEVSFQKNGDVTKLSAKVLGTAPNYDVALLQTTANARAPILYLGNSDPIAMGDWVMAVGNPFGLSHSVSVGIISAKERRDIHPSGRTGVYDFLQTDASINPGNSGGPLINLRGEVIGMNTAINAAGSGIGFAIPINMVKVMLPVLLEKGHFGRSWLGLRVQPMDDGLAESFGLGQARGALVAEVVSAGPADKAGILPGDVILSFDGIDIRSSADLPIHASLAGVGHATKLGIWREGKALTVEVVLAEMQDDGMASGAATPGSSGDLGFMVADLTPALREQLGLTDSVRAFVKDVEPGSPAALAGLQPGDGLVSVNAEAVTSARQAAGLIKAAPTASVLRLRVLRQERQVFVAIRKP